MGESGKKRIGEILILDGVLKRAQLKSALAEQKEQGGLIGQILIRRGDITEENLVAALSRQLKVPYISLADYAVHGDAIERLEEDFCHRHMLVVVDEDDKNIYLAVSDPLDESVIQEVESRTGLKAQVFISAPSEISKMLSSHLASGGRVKESGKAG